MTCWIEKSSSPFTCCRHSRIKTGVIQQNLLYMSDPFPSSLGIPFDQILHQQRNVILPLAQGWNTYGENVKPIKKILAERTGSNGSFQVAVRCGKHSHVDGNRLAAPDPLEFSFLEH